MGCHRTRVPVPQQNKDYQLPYRVLYTLYFIDLLSHANPCLLPGYPTRVPGYLYAGLGSYSTGLSLGKGMVGYGHVRY